jgi:hypothetical protein
MASVAKRRGPAILKRGKLAGRVRPQEVHPIASAARPLHIRRLTSGGLITNYYCTSRCAHCLYCCSPQWEKRYIDAATTWQNLEKIRSLGCRAVHVGGGEPFLDPQGLLRVLTVARDVGVRIEYVETNSSWYRDRDSAAARLRELKNRGLEALLISISPFHNEYIPFRKVKGVIEACRVTGLAAFPWISDFYKEVDAFDPHTPHRLAEYQEKFGADYLKGIPQRYWINFGGRAVKTFAGVLPTFGGDAILNRYRGGCRELQDVSHFHLDLFGNYIPGLCAGLAIQRDDLGSPLSPEKYPLLARLHESGINGLFALAREHGFEATGAYLSKCHLCLDIRRYLVMDRGLKFTELAPRGFYENFSYVS